MADRFASAAARLLASERGLENLAIVGSGQRGRVTVSDVRRVGAPHDPARAVPELGERGRQLWLGVHAQWTLRPDEELILIEACRTADELDRLEQRLAKASPTVLGNRGRPQPNPLLGQARAHRLALRQLLAAVGLAEADAERDSGKHGDERSHAGRQLARQRWGPHG